MKSLTESLTITEVTSPYTFEFKEVMFYCKFVFGLNEEEVDQINKQLMEPYKIFPDKIHLITAKKGDNLVGFAITYYLHDFNLAYMEYICVLPQHRRQGIGTAIYQHVLELLINDHGEIHGVLFEVNHEKEGLTERLNFFNRQGANPLDVSDVPMFKEYEMHLFYHPLDKNWLFASKQIPQIMQDLTDVWIW